MKNILLFSVILVLLAGSCRNQGAPGQEQSAAAGQTPPPPAAQTPAQVQLTPAAEQLPSVPFETIEMLWEKCDYIDFIFYNLNISMSQNEKASIQNTIRHISDKAPTIMQECPAQGRVFFQVNGQNALEGDFFLTQGCLYYVFYKDGKKAYANAMTVEGVQFFQNILTKMLNSSQPQ